MNKRSSVIEKLKQGQEFVVSEHEGHDSLEEICFPIYINGRIIGAIGIISDVDEREDIILHYSGTKVIRSFFFMPRTKRKPCNHYGYRVLLIVGERFEPSISE